MFQAITSSCSAVSCLFDEALGVSFLGSDFDTICVFCAGLGGSTVLLGFEAVGGFWVDKEGLCADEDGFWAVLSVEDFCTVLFDGFCEGLFVDDLGFSAKDFWTDFAVEGFAFVSVDLVEFKVPTEDFSFVCLC